MAAAEQDNSWRGRRHKTVRDWMGQPDVVAKIAEEQEQLLREEREGVKPPKPEGLERPPGVAVPRPPAPVLEIIRTEEKKPTVESNHGRLFVFRPAQVRVVIVKERVGQAWDGTLIHEVVTEDGRRFLASERQLQAVS